jgi:hypothetical protein
MALGSLIPKTDFSQLVHLGKLRAHYQEHQLEAALQHQSFTFFDFVYIHFINPDEHTDANHEEEHQQLPFQTITNAIVFIINHQVIPKFATRSQILLQHIAYNNPFYLGGFLTNATQPPSG